MKFHVDFKYVGGINYFELWTSNFFGRFRTAFNTSLTTFMNQIILRCNYLITNNTMDHNTIAQALLDLSNTTALCAEHIAETEAQAAGLNFPHPQIILS